MAFVRLSFWEGCCPSVPVTPGAAMTILTPKPRFSLIFALHNPFPSSPRSLSGGTASPHMQTDGRTEGQCWWSWFQRCRSTHPPGRGTSILIKISQFGCFLSTKRSRALPAHPAKETSGGALVGRPRDMEQGRHTEPFALTAHFPSCFLLRLFSSNKGIQEQSWGRAVSAASHWDLGSSGGGARF